MIHPYVPASCSCFLHGVQPALLSTTTLPASVTADSTRVENQLGDSEASDEYPVL